MLHLQACRLENKGMKIHTESTLSILVIDTIKLRHFSKLVIDKHGIYYLSPGKIQELSIIVQLRRGKKDNWINM